ncbi:hypothetical protein, partial [Burkholderia ambifaria]|uniref:hypothetical protein n=1 Tax=Burkholderia ambifaria TaxID=152480 RepID=UPI001ABA4A01
EGRRGDGRGIELAERENKRETVDLRSERQADRRGESIQPRAVFFDAVGNLVREHMNDHYCCNYQNRK